LVRFDINAPKLTLVAMMSNGSSQPKADMAFDANLRQPAFVAQVANSHNAGRSCCLNFFGQRPLCEKVLFGRFVQRSKK
jgi:hypothetical protein